MDLIRRKYGAQARKEVNCLKGYGKISLKLAGD
jgi:hypothetical protein